MTIKAMQHLQLMAWWEWHLQGRICGANCSRPASVASQGRPKMTSLHVSVLQ